MLHKKALLLGISFMLPFCSMQAHSASRAPENGDYSFETSQFMQTNFYRFPTRMAVIGKDLLSTGAWGSSNAVFDSGGGAVWYLEDQSHADDAIMCGISKNDSAVINRALIAYDWTFRHQKKDGSFDAGDNFHGTALFVEAVSHSCIMLNKSKFAAAYKSRIKTLKAEVLKSALWLIDPKSVEMGLGGDKPFTYRRYLMAAAIGETGILCSDLQLQFVAKPYVDDGLKLQDQAGFNAENGGFDCSYQAVGLKYAHRYYDNVADNPTKEKLLAMYEKGVTWLEGRIRSNGVPHIEGNTITGFGPETGRDAELNKINYTVIAESISWWAFVKNDTQATILAQAVADARFKN